jgi:pimeloyl-ACP methyl ester carboxylesterase
MADFLLIHGACHGAWCWRDLIPALIDRGHTARAIDLPGHGGDLTPIPDITLDAYAKAILAAISAPVTLVGHSMAGFPITRAAALAPAKIARLIYLCAYVPRAGLTLAEMRRKAPRQPLMPALMLSEDRTSFRIDPARTEALFYHDCPDGTAAFANTRLCAQAVQPMETPCLTNASLATIPRAYIRCSEDQTIPPEYQRTMTQDWPAEAVHDFPTAHSPFLADPSGLAALLTRIVR